MARRQMIQLEPLFSGFTFQTTGFISGYLKGPSSEERERNFVILLWNATAAESLTGTQMEHSFTSTQTMIWLRGSGNRVTYGRTGDKSFTTVSYPLCPPPTVLMLLPTILQQTASGFPPSPTEGEWRERPFPFWTASWASASLILPSQGVCADLLHMVAKMISWLTHKESLKLSGVRYIIWRGGKGGGDPEVQSSQTQC